MSGDNNEAVYVLARNALLTTIEALKEHKEALILVGAQAVYLQTEALRLRLAVAPFTKDADIALNPDQLSPDPKLIEALERAGFQRRSKNPGLWEIQVKSGAAPIPVDLLVPGAVSGAGRRGARLGGHGNNAAMKSPGLEGALVDYDLKTISALEESDSRSYQLNVAGPAALLVAKLTKISERIHEDKRSRVINKDAYDIFRLLRAFQTEELKQRWSLLSKAEVSKAVSLAAHRSLRELFSTRGSTGVQLLRQHTQGLVEEEEEEELVASCLALVDDLLRSLG